MGSVRPRGSSSWLVDFYAPNGKRYRETLQLANRAEAERELKKRAGDLAHGQPLFANADKVTFDDLAKDFIRDYEVNGRRSVGKAKKSVERLTEFFGGWRAVNITTQDVRTYVATRQRAAAANGSVNRELAALRRAFRLAVKARVLSHDHVPDIPMLKEAPPRAGFFEPKQFQALLRHLRPEVKPVALFAYETGWRLREIITLEWRQVDLTQGSVRLDPGTTKNREGRLIYVSPQLLEVLRAQGTATRDLERAKGIIVPQVSHRRGKRILRFLASWQTACKTAGVPGMFFHDLRRTAVRNMVRAGVPERVAMQVSGHKTRSVFERYNIISVGDLQEAACRIATYHGMSGKILMHGLEAVANRRERSTTDGPAPR